jgi:hypothetical protein
MGELLFLRPEYDPAYEADTRARWEAELREEYGQEWLDANKARLDAEWEYVKSLL